jgi:hypothetical protein
MENDVENNKLYENNLFFCDLIYDIVKSRVIFEKINLLLNKESLVFGSEKEITLNFPDSDSCFDIVEEEVIDKEWFFDYFQKVKQSSLSDVELDVSNSGEKMRIKRLKKLIFLSESNNFLEKSRLAPFTSQKSKNFYNNCSTFDIDNHSLLIEKLSPRCQFDYSFLLSFKELLIESTENSTSSSTLSFRDNKSKMPNSLFQEIFPAEIQLFDSLFVHLQYSEWKNPFPNDNDFFTFIILSLIHPNSLSDYLILIVYIIIYYL